MTRKGQDYGHAYFRDNGKGYRNKIAGGCLYAPNGLRKDASGDYNLISIGENDGLTFPGSTRPLVGSIIIDSSGRVKKSGTYTIGGIRYL